MNLVIQKHPQGCALACAAMLAGKSYDEIEEIAAEIGIIAGDKTLYSSTEPMHQLLAHLEISVTSGETHFTDWSIRVEWYQRHSTQREASLPTRPVSCANQCFFFAR